MHQLISMIILPSVSYNKWYPYDYKLYPCYQLEWSDIWCEWQFRYENICACRIIRSAFNKRGPYSIKGRQYKNKHFLHDTTGACVIDYFRQYSCIYFRLYYTNSLKSSNWKWYKRKKNDNLSCNCVILF